MKVSFYFKKKKWIRAPLTLSLKKQKGLDLVGAGQGIGRLAMRERKANGEEARG